MPASTYRVQRRGGRGIIGQVLREEDALRHIVAANARDSILFFTDHGQASTSCKAWQVPSYDRTARGTPLINVIDVEPGETVTAILAAPDFENSDFLIFATQNGEVKKSRAERLCPGAPQRPARDEPRRRRRAARRQALPRGRRHHPGHRARPVGALQRRHPAHGQPHQRRRARHSAARRAIKLASMDVVVPEAQLLVVTRNGFGKRTPLSAFPRKGRGIGGVRAIKTTAKTGPWRPRTWSKGDEELMMISAGGIVIRMADRDDHRAQRPLDVGRQTDAAARRRQPGGDRHLSQPERQRRRWRGRRRRTLSADGTDDGERTRWLPRRESVEARGRGRRRRRGRRGRRGRTRDDDWAECRPERRRRP